jgi:hypothetical protein
MGRSGNAKNPSFTPLPYLPVTLMQEDLVDLETCKVISRGRKGKVLTPAHFGCLQGNSTLNSELLDLLSKNTGYALFH